MKTAACSFISVAALLGVVAACGESPAAPSAAGQRESVASPAMLLLQASAWTTISDPANVPLTNDSRGRLVFDFPANGSINYVYTVQPPTVISGTVSVSLEITTSGPVLFNYMTEPSNTCHTPSSVRPF